MRELQTPILSDSITRIGPDAAGAVVVTGSHGGVYAAWLARKGGCRAAIFNDAGVGRDQAGIGGLAWLDAHGMAAAAIDHRSADIGDAEAMLAHGVVSHANARAAALGVVRGQNCEEAARLLAGASLPEGSVEPVSEAREEVLPEGANRRIVLIDSASLVEPRDAGQIVISGSHGALFGDDPINALKYDGAFAAFNDAGGGVGVSRLPALQGRGIAAVTVSAESARIGDARSTFEDGVISAANPAALSRGARIGEKLHDCVIRLARMP
ncbi:MAG: hypothetical protein JJU21_11205 [Salinarimonas sp.]|nr:hypothetical protein [Salinarimonas sp.]